MIGSSFGPAGTVVGVGIGLVGGVILYEEVFQPIYLNKKKTGKNDKHAGQKAKEAVRKKYEEAKEKFDELSRKPNKTPHAWRSS